MREQVIQVVEQYLDAVRRNDASALPLHHATDSGAVCEALPEIEQELKLAN